MACTDCAAAALGIQTDAQFLLDYPGCTDGQHIYCVDGALTAAPRGCTKVFGEARHDYFGDPITTADLVPGADFHDLDTAVDFTVTNDTCYPMNLTFNESASWSGYIYELNQDSLNSELFMSFQLWLDGVLRLDTSASGGGGKNLGNNFAPYTHPSVSYTVFSVAPLAPGASTLVSVHPRINNITELDPRTYIEAWASAIRVTGTTVCP